MLVGAALAARRVLVVVRVEGSSMLPTYTDGDRLLAVRRPYAGRVRRGDVVVVDAPAVVPSTGREVLVKRVHAIAGDVVIDPNGQTRVPPGSVHVRGDSGLTYDSRRFGPVDLRNVVGKVIARLTQAS